MLDAAAKVGVFNETLGDLGIVVDGLLDLTRAAGELRPGADVRGTAQAVGTPASAPNSASQPNAIEPSKPAVGEGTIYDGTSADVTPPVAIFQQAPSTTSSSLVAGIMATVRNKSGTISVTINEKGIAEDAVVIESVQPLYDQLLVSAALAWRYRPATRAGVPVKYRKTIRVEVQR